MHKLMIPFFLLRLSLVLGGLATIFMVMLGIDYLHILGRLAENKRLKGENFKLRQEIQLIRNKVDNRESTVERVRNYAKKLQILTGQGDKGGAEIPWGPSETEPNREPSNKPEHHSNAQPLDPEVVLASAALDAPLPDRVEKLQNASLITEENLSRLQSYLLAQSAVMNATPSLLPINGWLSSTFGYRRNPYDGVYRLHAGVDIAAEPGTPVRAPADGEVIFSGAKEGYGKVVVIDHGYGIRTVFAHNSKLFATVGLRVKRGDIISEVGSTGHSTGPHLHYEIRKNGVPVNPATFLSRLHF